MRILADVFVLIIFVGGYLFGTFTTCSSERSRQRQVDSQLREQLCVHAEGELRMAKVLLQRAQPGDVDAALLVVGAVGPTMGYCRRDPEVERNLERAARHRELAREIVSGIVAR